MGFRPTCSDPYVWIRGRKGGCNYIGMHNNYVILLAVNPTSIFNKLKYAYKIQAFGPPKFHLGCDYLKVNKGANTHWVMVSSKYTAKDLSKVCTLLKVTT